MRLVRILPFFRHPELVSGSIVRLALPNWWQTQPDRKVSPMRVSIIDQIDFPRAAPILELLLPRNGCLHRDKHLKMHQIIYTIFGRMAARQTITMLRQAFQQIRRDANVNRAVMLAGEYVYAGLSFLSHQWSVVAKWTLKKVQGDVISGKISCFFFQTVTLNSFQGPPRMGQPTAGSTHD